MPIASNCQLLIDTHGHTVRLRQLPGAEGLVELTPAEAEAVADELREAAKRARGEEVLRALFAEGGSCILAR